MIGLTIVVYEIRVILLSTKLKIKMQNFSKLNKFNIKNLWKDNEI